MVQEGWYEPGGVLQSRGQIASELGPVIVKISETNFYQLCVKSMLSQMYVEPDKGKNYLCID
jgi:hypothetical protein